MFECGVCGFSPIRSVNLLISNVSHVLDSQLKENTKSCALYQKHTKYSHSLAKKGFQSIHSMASAQRSSCERLKAALPCKSNVFVPL